MVIVTETIFRSGQSEEIMISIIVIAELANCREIESVVSNSLNVGENAAIIYRNSIEDTWQLYRCNPYAYDFAIVDLDQEKNSLQHAVKSVQQAVMHNGSLEIVFMTGREYVPVDIYSVSHIHLIKKPLSAEKIRNLVRLLYYRKSFLACYDMQRFQVRHGRNICFVHRDEVQYAKKARYGLDLKTSERILPFDKKMDSFLQEWGNSFFRCHDSFAVNVRYVSEVRNNSVFLCSGEEIPVSRAYKKAVKKYFDELYEGTV